MGTNPDYGMSMPEGQDNQVTWIGRDRAFERVESPEAPVALAPRAQHPSRWLWTAGAVAALLLTVGPLRALMGRVRGLIDRVIVALRLPLPEEG